MSYVLQMKREREYSWIVILLNSEYVHRGIFSNPKGACKKDFERLVNAPENSSVFHEWFNELIEDGAIIPHGDIYKGENNNFKVHAYVVNFKVLYARLKLNKVYKLSKKIFDREKVI